MFKKISLCGLCLFLALGISRGLFADEAQGYSEDNPKIQDALTQMGSSHPLDQLAGILALQDMPPEQASEAWFEVLTNPTYDATVHCAAAEALGEAGVEKAVPYMVKDLDSENPHVRRSSAAALAQVGGEETIEPLLNGLSEDNPDVLDAVAQALSTKGEAASQALIKELTNDHRRAGAAKALGLMGEHKAVEHLLKLVDEPTDGQKEVIEALGRIGDEQSLGFLEEILSDEDIPVPLRQAAAQALGAIGTERALEMLEKAVEDDDGTKTMMAREALLDHKRAQEDHEKQKEAEEKAKEQEIREETGQPEPSSDGQKLTEDALNQLQDFLDIPLGDELPDLPPPGTGIVSGLDPQVGIESPAKDQSPQNTEKKEEPQTEGGPDGNQAGMAKDTVAILEQILGDESAPPSAREAAAYVLGSGAKAHDSEAAKFASVQSTFAQGTEGWTVSGDAQGDSVVPRNKGGALLAKDNESGGVWYWKAPEKFLGDKSGAYGKTLSFSLRQSATDSQFKTEDIILQGGGLKITHNLDHHPGRAWTYYSVPLSPDHWKTAGGVVTKDQMHAVLSNMKALYIRGEFRDGEDTGGLDYVVLGGSAEEAKETERQNRNKELDQKIAALKVQIRVIQGDLGRVRERIIELGGQIEEYEDKADMAFGEIGWADAEGRGAAVWGQQQQWTAERLKEERAYLEKEFERVHRLLQEKTIQLKKVEEEKQTTGSP